ncbi:MAG TPA: M4 family metallopeptidase, partial [Candidatus Obscuribacterales bacterium]
MGHTGEGTKDSVAAKSEQQISLRDYMLAQATEHAMQEVLSGRPIPADAQHHLEEAAPAGAGERLWEVTKDGIKKIPQGFIHSLDPRNIIPNVAIGFGIGAGTKLLLPKAGPVGKVAAAAIGLYFVGKPLLTGYGKAYFAETRGDMDEASTILGDTVGGMPVAIVEGGIGAKLGAGAMGKLLATRGAQPFVNWKEAQFAKLDRHVDTASAGVQNFAFKRLGIGSPVMLGEGRSGFVPPYVLETLAKNTRDPAFLETIKKTEALRLGGPRLTRATPEIGKDYKGAREVYDAQGQETIGVKARSEGQAKTGNVEVDTVYDYTGDVRSFYKEVHGRNSIDGNGMKMESTVNYGVNFENAFWDGARMTYGRPGPQSPFKTFIKRDVTGHEITHGVTAFESNLVYRNQPGALNEHLSDVYGALVEQRVLGQKAREATWLVGDGIWKEGVKGRALRDMKNPGTAYDDPMLGKDPQPAHMKDFVRTRRDNGGVH